MSFYKVLAITEFCGHIKYIRHEILQASHCFARRARPVLVLRRATGRSRGFPGSSAVISYNLSCLQFFLLRRGSSCDGESTKDDHDVGANPPSVPRRVLIVSLVQMARICPTAVLKVVLTSSGSIWHLAATRGCRQRHDRPTPFLTRSKKKKKSGGFFFLIAQSCVPLRRPYQGLRVN